MENHFKKNNLNTHGFFICNHIFTKAILYFLKKREDYQRLSEIWELDPETTCETFILSTYKPVSVLES
jgi:phospholipase A1